MGDNLEESVNKLNLTIQSMQLSDLKQVLEIEKQSFNAPWSLKSFKKELTQNPYANYLVGKKAGVVLGYVGAWIVLNESHITTLAVASAYRRQKVARQLLFELFSQLKEEGVEKVTLEVRTSNQVARKLYKGYGFEEMGVRKDYYQDNQEDAVVMWKTLN